MKPVGTCRRLGSDADEAGRRCPQLVVVPAEQLADALSCPVCLGLLLDPLIAACCQNNFCRQCLSASLRSKPQCPLCRAPLQLENTLPNRAIRNLLPARGMLNLQVSTVIVTVSVY